MSEADIIRALADTQTSHGSSYWGTMRECPRRHKLRYDVGLERVTAEPREDYFEVGSLCHAVLRYVQDGVVAGEASPRRWLDVLEYASTHGANSWPLDEAS